MPVGDLEELALLASTSEPRYAHEAMPGAQSRTRDAFQVIPCDNPAYRVHDLPPLVTALYVKADDLLRDSPQLAPWRPEAGIAPLLSDAELVTLAMMQAMPGFTSGSRWLRHARAHLRHLFPLPAETTRLQQASLQSGLAAGSRFRP